MSIKPLGHYSIENPATVYDEEAMTALELAGRTTAKINECVDAVNNFTANTEQYIEDDVRNWLEEHPEATTTVLDHSLEETKFTEDALRKIKNYRFSPQMFGAKGDGVTDDSPAFQEMLNYVTSLLPVRKFPEEANCTDYSHVTFEFAGSYLVNGALYFSQTYGLTLDGLNLIAGPQFVGEGMLHFSGPTRNLRVSNCTINANLNALRCVYMTGYSLTTDFVNVELTRFKGDGFFAYGKGHEIKMVNCKINQVEWGEVTNIQSLVSAGNGIYLSSERHDNHFVNVVVNYCAIHACYIEGTANTFIGCHFYGAPVVNLGLHNFYQNCYFDGSKFDTSGFFTLSNCFFNRTGDDINPFISLIETKENEWRYDQASITGCSFRAQTRVETPIGTGHIGYIPSMTAYGNTFYYVDPFVVHSKSTAPNPWQKPLKHLGDSSAGYVSIADVKFIWGTASADGFQIYPDGVTLTHTFYVDIEKTTSDGQATVYANDIRTDRFYLNNTGGKTYKWLVIGR